MDQTRSTTGSRVVALVIIAAGVFFLLAQFGFFSFNLLGFLWPFFIIVPGLAFLYPALTGGRDAAPLAIPGAIITGTGAILLYQNITGHWDSWAYIWTLYPVFLGIGMILMGRRAGDRKADATGRGFVRWGLIAFLLLAAFFELFVLNNLGLGRYLLPLALILFGAWMLRGGRRSRDADFDLGSTPIKPKRTSASDELRRRIDIALAEDDEIKPE